MAQWDEGPSSRQSHTTWAEATRREGGSELPVPEAMQQWAKCPIFSERLHRVVPHWGPDFNSRCHPCIFLASVSSLPYSLPVLCSQEGEQWAFFPHAHLALLSPTPQPPFDPSYCSRMKTHFDRRDMSLPLDNRSCCFPVIQLPDGINCP